jgi:hypothetical protein
MPMMNRLDVEFIFAFDIRHREREGGKKNRKKRPDRHFSSESENGNKISRGQSVLGDFEDARESRNIATRRMPIAKIAKLSGKSSTLKAYTPSSKKRFKTLNHREWSTVIRPKRFSSRESSRRFFIRFGKRAKTFQFSRSFQTSSEKRATVIIGVEQSQIVGLDRTTLSTISGLSRWRFM